MLCNLRDVVRKLAQHYSLQTFGMIDIPIREIKRYREGASGNGNPNTLYIGTATDLKLISDSRDESPFMCVSESFTGIDFASSITQSAVILISCARPDDVYAALADIMYELGTQNACIPQMYRELYSCTSVQDMLNTASNFLKSPLLLVDDNYRIFDSSATEITKMLEERLQKDCAFFPNIASLFGSSLSEFELSLPHGPEKAAVYMLQKVYAFLFPMKDEHDFSLGYLVLCRQSSSITDDIVDNCILLMRYLVMELRHLDPPSEIGSETEKFLQSVLTAKFSTQAEYTHYMQMLHWTPRENLYAICFSNGGQICSVPFAQSLQRYLNLLPGAKGATLRGQVILLFEMDSPLESKNGSEALLPLAADLEQNGLHCGISHAFHSVMEFHVYYREAVSALELGKVFEPDTRVHWYDRCAVYQLLESAEKQADIQTYIADGLRRLVQYDEATGSELVTTLEAYLRCRGSVTQCAQQLFLHISTVKYRISKIESVLGYDLSDGENFFQLYLSMKILQYRQTYTKLFNF